MSSVLQIFLKQYNLHIYIHDIHSAAVVALSASNCLPRYSQLCTINFCIASNEWYLTFGSSAESNFITACLPCNCSILLEKKLINIIFRKDKEDMRNELFASRIVSHIFPNIMNCYAKSQCIRLYFQNLDQNSGKKHMKENNRSSNVFMQR